MGTETEFNCEYCEDTGMEYGTCGCCAGSGEGSYAGSSCPICKGLGVAYCRCTHCNIETEEESL